MEPNPFLEKQIKKAIELVRKENYSALSFLIIDTAFRNISIEDVHTYSGSEEVMKMVEEYVSRKFSPLDTDQKIGNSLKIAIFYVEHRLFDYDYDK